MKKFLFLYVGAQEARSEETMRAWQDWFASVGDSFVDSGNPLGAGRYLNGRGPTDLPSGQDAITGYSLVNADSMEAAESIAATCPTVSGIRVYEALPM